MRLGRLDRFREVSEGGNVVGSLLKPVWARDRVSRWGCEVMNLVRDGRALSSNNGFSDKSIS